MKEMVGDRMIGPPIDQQAGFIPFCAGRLGDPVGWKFVLEFGGEHQTSSMKSTSTSWGQFSNFKILRNNPPLPFAL